VPLCQAICKSGGTCPPPSSSPVPHGVGTTARRGWLSFRIRAAGSERTTTSKAGTDDWISWRDERTCRSAAFWSCCTARRPTRYISLQVRLLSAEKLQRHARKKYRSLNGRLQKLWDEFYVSDWSTSSFLWAASHLQLSNWQWPIHLHHYTVHCLDFTVSVYVCFCSNKSSYALL